MGQGETNRTDRKARKRCVCGRRQERTAPGGTDQPAVVPTATKDFPRGKTENSIPAYRKNQFRMG